VWCVTIPNAMPTRRVTLSIILFLAPVLVILVAVALSARPSAPEASFAVPIRADWHGRWETGVPGVKLIPLYVSPPRRVVVSVARDIESPAIAKETIERLGLKMTPEELLENLSAEADPEIADGIRLTYRDPTAENPQRARRIVRAFALSASGRVRVETSHPYDWVV
jgi:hypothetical protein